MERKNIFKYTAGVLCLLFVISIIPLLILAQYNHSWADDYSYGLLAYTAWNQTHSLWQVLLAAVEQVKSSYLYWQGTFSGIFFMAIQPGIFGEEFYKITTYILLLLLCSSVLYFLKVILVDYLSSVRSIWLITCCVILFLIIQLMPDPVQAFYWYNGSLYYLGFFSLFLFLVSIYLKLLYTENRKKHGNIKRVFVTILLAALVGGSNYVGSLLAVEITLAIIIAASFMQIKTKRLLYPSFITLVVSFGISIIAPGNAVRAATFLGARKGVIQSIYYSFRYGIEFINEWLDLYLILAFMFLIPFLWRTIKRKNGIEKYCRFPLLMIAFSFCLFASSFTPTLYSTGGLGQNIEAAGRVQNIRYVLFVFLILVNVIYILGWLKPKLPNGERTVLFTYKDICYYFCFIIVSIGIMLMCPKDFNNLTSVSAVYTFYTGELQEYKRETAERKALLESDEKIVTLKPYYARPRLLYYYNDIQPDEHDWKNETIAIWYGKERVYLSEE
ncbi:hypothetical protein C0033_08550 [Clostridium sp. chh4-2]|uniref:DUF6056 family protein n=1 Tax=Clostridium sp. chh4-2 TaxID=2067550 RepID=UPI000CCFA18E|nr:DUF6056 family protein [Clostridium sp. chh4-2]PNV62597.1 hypothetical protein C0033_08550 [Clostridium sp. chh4-2]